MVDAQKLRPARRVLGQALAWYRRKEREERQGIVGARWTFGTIQTTTPTLTVILEHDTDPTPAGSLGYVPPIGSRVHVVVAAGQAIILAAPPA